MTAQTVFNKIVRHLRKQGKKAKASPTLCAYLAEDGSKCAVGCMISKKNYKKAMEGSLLYSLIEKKLLPRHLLPHAQLLSCMQSIHDGCNVSAWEDAFQSTAEKFNLKVPA